jgi:class 3 adenylate cyclase/tetratricopeptide (TPR) repeat protein
MRCPACGGDTPDGKRFCQNCGATLAAVCFACGSQLGTGSRFCADCGTAIGAAIAPETSPAVPADGAQRPPRGAASTELRHVSVLFCDLVGFTPLAERRDPEEVRELLSGYFDLARSIVSRYGGIVEKFIGDAVMALWGAPVAREDDAERAVRAGIELVASVATYGSERVGSELAARVGIVTGTVATTETPDEGLVVGDRVNTAARIQALAPPGCCYVDESTRRATEAAVVYADAGTHPLKGKSEQVRLYDALRVVAGVGGALKSEGLEASSVGRDRELRLVKDLFHTSAEGARAHLVSVTGIAGIGKSRLAWEFYKYMDGISGVSRWHRGRCVSYGEGVAYWALAEMVRGRAGILEGEDAASAGAKLHAAVEEHVSDTEERRWVEPRLAHLIGLEEKGSREREDLFAGWRLFFERMAERDPVVMSFEDMQWADASLLDFIEYLLDWSRNHAIFVLTLARPELVERRPNWGAGRRNFTSIYLDPLSVGAMTELVDGLVPGLPDEERDRILARAEGVPLYAVETVRMMIDRGLVVRDGARYRPIGPLGALEVPETLQALIAARLDGLTAAERSLLQDAAVVGKSFTRPLMLRLTGLEPGAVDDLFASLVRKEVIALQADPRSPERGQYSFLQDLVRSVAYETLTRRDRKDKHLAVAAYLESSRGADEDEFVEVIASHYLKAYELGPDAADGSEVKAKAREMLVRAGERAAAIAAAEEGQGYFLQALELSDDVATRAVLEERAGQMALARGRAAEARFHFERATNSFASAERVHAAARVTARLGEVDFAEGRLDKGIERMEQAFSLLVDDEPDEDLTSLAVQLGRLHLFHGDRDLAMERNEFALRCAELLMLPEQLSQAMNTKAVGLRYEGRRQEARLLLDYALRVALEHDLSSAALRAMNNLAAFAEMGDEYDEVISHVTAKLELARRVGDRLMEMDAIAHELPTMVITGRWNEALERIAEIRRAEDATAIERLLVFLLSVLPVFVNRGDIDGARELHGFCAPLDNAEELQARSTYLYICASLYRAEGRYEEALESAEAALTILEDLGMHFVGANDAFVEAIESALALLETGKAEELLERIEGVRPGEKTPFLQAQALRFRAKLTSSGGESRVGSNFSRAATMFRELRTPFWLAVTMLEHGEWLIAQERAGETAALFAEVQEVFEQLGARPWLDRLALATSVAGNSTPDSSGSLPSAH